MDPLHFIFNNPLNLHGPAPAVPIEKVLDVSMERYKLENWCWAAVSRAIARAYHGNSNAFALRQCDVAIAVHHNTCCPPGNHDPQQCNVPETLPTPLAPHFAALLQIGFAPTHRTENLVRGEIDAGRPIAVRIEWRKDAVVSIDPAGHFVIISGYTTVGTSLEFVHVFDPVQDARDPVKMPFAKFRDDYKNQGFWEGTYLTTGTAGSLTKVPFR